MSIFSLGRKPRRFHHTPIFYDERTDRLREIEERARQAAGLEPKSERRPEDLRGTFTQASPLLQRHRERQGRWSSHIGVLFLLILVCAVIWFLLLK